MESSHDRHRAQAPPAPVVRGDSTRRQRELGLGSLFVLTALLTIWLVAGPGSLRMQLLVGIGIGTTIIGVAISIGRGRTRSARALAVVAGLCVLAFAALAAVDSTYARVGAMVILLLVGFAAPVSIIAGLRRHRRLDMSLLLGATTIYLLVGIAFAMGYSIIAVAEPSGLLMVDGERTDATLSDRVYFSYITLSTTGYGDFTPASSIARALAILEALGGQLYLVIAMTSVVTTLLQQRRQ